LTWSGTIDGQTNKGYGLRLFVCSSRGNPNAAMRRQVEHLCQPRVPYVTAYRRASSLVLIGIRR